MKHFRKIVFYSFLVSTISIIAFAFWIFLSHPSQAKIAEAFPENSFQTFSDGKKVTLYSLKPSSKIEGKETFQGYTVIGKTEIENYSFKKFLKHAFLNDIANAFEIGATCFNPRHGLRVADGKKNLDLVICFECEKFISFSENKKGEGTLSGISQTLFDKTLKDSGIKIEK